MIIYFKNNKTYVLNLNDEQYLNYSIQGASFSDIIEEKENEKEKS